MKLFKNKFILAGLLALTAAPQVSFAAKTVSAAVDHARFTHLRSSISHAMGELHKISATRGFVAAPSAAGGEIAKGAEHNSAASVMREASPEVREEMNAVLRTVTKAFGANGDTLLTSLTAANKDANPNYLNATLSVLAQVDDATLARMTDDPAYAAAATDLLSYYVATNKYGMADDMSLQTRMAHTLDSITDADTLKSLKGVTFGIAKAVAVDLPAPKKGEAPDAFARRAGSAKSLVSDSLTKGIGTLQSQIKQLYADRTKALPKDVPELSNQIAFLEGKVKLYENARDGLTRITDEHFTRESVMMNPIGDFALVKEAMFDLKAREELLKKGLNDEEITFLLNHCGVRA